VPALLAILREPSVARWWGIDEPHDDLAAKIAGRTEEVQLVVEVDGAVAGGIEYFEEPEPQYRHAGVDIYLATAYQGRGLGGEAVGLLVDYLLHERGHHRLTIDPAATNLVAIRCYERVGFRPVGVLREYERGLDGTYHDGLLMELLASDVTPGRTRGSPGSGSSRGTSRSR
jgi:aminoglycoside 6'-N-acetyltransferase